jgi:hypothetical protein
MQSHAKNQIVERRMRRLGGCGAAITVRRGVDPLAVLVIMGLVTRKMRDIVSRVVHLFVKKQGREGCVGSIEGCDGMVTIFHVGCSAESMGD